MRLKSEIIVAAELKHSQSLGLFATIIHKGDETAGQIYFILSKNNVDFLLLGPPLGTSFDEEGQKLWDYPLGEGLQTQQQIDDYLSKIRKFDSDIYIVEIEDRTLTYRPVGIFPVSDEGEISPSKQQAENLFNF